MAGEGPLIAYFEIYRMTPGADGQARFEYEYTVESEERDTRPWFQRVLPFGAREPHYAVRSEEANFGPLRRQFITRAGPVAAAGPLPARGPRARPEPGHTTASGPRVSSAWARRRAGRRGEAGGDRAFSGEALEDPGH